MYKILFYLSIISSIFCDFPSPSAIVHMTQNTLNGAKFFELRRAPQKKITIPDSFEIKANFTPKIFCDAEHIGLLLNENFPDVRIFASEHGHISECSRRFSIEFQPEFVTKFDGPCGVKRQYKGIRPFSSIDYTLRLLVSHNPSEMTEYDRIFDLKCSFQQNSNEVHASFEIITPPIVSLSSPSPPRKGPKCKYSLHHGTVQGPKTAQAHVGEVIYHRWKCAAPQDLHNRQQNYIFKVYACVVHDENNRTYTIIDENGCSLDEEIIPTPEYDVPNGLIYTPSRAFRFANSNHVHFKCMISVCSANEETCQNSVPPKCKKVPKKRQVQEEMTIEQRLLRIHELMKQKKIENGKNWTMEVKRGGQKALGTELVQTEPLQVVNRDYDHLKYESVLRSYQIWTWVLCSLNVFLVVLCICVTFRLLKNKYIMDIKDTSNTVFRRVPF